jgi:hypothetical protein
VSEPKSVLLCIRRTYIGHSTFPLRKGKVSSSGPTFGPFPARYAIRLCDPRGSMRRPSPYAIPVALYAHHDCRPPFPANLASPIDLCGAWSGSRAYLAAHTEGRAAVKMIAVAHSMSILLFFNTGFLTSRSYTSAAPDAIFLCRRR